MAGLGAKLFTAFSKLTAAQVNGYLMDQSIMRFATSAARDAAFGGAGEPTLAEGMTCYLDDTNVLQSYNGTTWVEIASTDGKAPRGIVQYVSTSGTTTATSTEQVTLTLPSFTAVANRYYRITYFEPYLETLATNVELSVKIKLTNISGTVIALGETFIPGLNTEGQVQAVVVKTLTAGATVIVGTIQTAGGNCYAYGSATYLRQLWVEDIGSSL